MAHGLIIFVLVLTLDFSIVPTAASPAPFQLTPSVKSYGPDGPWWAVNVLLGAPPQSIDMLPAVNTESYVLTDRTCSHNLVCGEGGVYNLTNSSTSVPVHYGGDTSGQPRALGSIDTNATSLATLDSLYLLSPTVAKTVGPVVIHVANFSFYRVSNLEEILGNGVHYPQQTGQLSLGPPTPLATTYGGNGSVIPQALETQKNISSSSYGLHYGSVNLNQPISLWMGGYDQQRVVGPVSTQPADNQFNLPIDLLDIGIGVATGGSPFPFSSQSGLLGAKNTSIGSHVTVYMYPALPYLSLPNSTCNAIAALLPVTYNYTLGLYIWNTADPSYNPIRNSPAYLNFTFRASASLTQNITINVPFSLLNLTLEPPLVSTPTPYFPCQPPLPGAKFSLGRAFLQAAFVGALWDNTPSSWFLAQAPGPNIASQPSPVEFNGGTVTASQNQWVDTWKDVWTPLPNATASSEAEPLITDGPKPGLSGGVIAGIVIAVLVGCALLFAGAFVIYKRQRRQRQQQQREFLGVGGDGGGGAGVAKESQYASGLTEMSDPHSSQQHAELSPLNEQEKAELGHDPLLTEMEAQHYHDSHGNPAELFDPQSPPSEHGGTELDGTAHHGGGSQRDSRTVSSL